MLHRLLYWRKPNKPLFGTQSGSPQSRMPRSRSRTDVDIPSEVTDMFVCNTVTVG